MEIDDALEAIHDVSRDLYVEQRAPTLEETQALENAYHELRKRHERAREALDNLKGADESIDEHDGERPDWPRMFGVYNARIPNVIRDLSRALGQRQEDDHDS